MGIEGKAESNSQWHIPAGNNTAAESAAKNKSEILTFLRENAGGLSVRAMADAPGFSTSYVYQLLRLARVPAGISRSLNRAVNPLKIC